MGNLDPKFLTKTNYLFYDYFLIEAIKSWSELLNVVHFWLNYKSNFIYQGKNEEAEKTMRKIAEINGKKFPEHLLKNDSLNSNADLDAKRHEPLFFISYFCQMEHKPWLLVDSPIKD